MDDYGASESPIEREIEREGQDRDREREEEEKIRNGNESKLFDIVFQEINVTYMAEVIDKS